MFKKLCMLLITLFMTAPPGHAIEIEGITVPDSVSTQYGRLILNGAGVRSKFLVNAYVAGLYLKQKKSDPKAIIAADELMAIRLHITSTMITGKIMETAIRQGFIKATRGNMTPIQSEIETLISVFKDKIQKNDIYQLIYIPTHGVEAFKNGRKKSLSIGIAFKQALFGIWLCDNPVQKRLKEELLGE